MDPNLIMNRIMRLARLDTSPFDEVRDDQRETIPAIAIVAISALISGIGSWLWLLFLKPDGYGIDYANVILLIWLLGTIITVAMWGVWVAVTMVVLNSFYKETVDIQSLIRTMGYSSFPFAASFLMVVPFFSFGFAVAAVVLWAVLSTFAVQAATTAESDRVIKANLIGFLAFAILLGVFARGIGIGTGLFLNADNVADNGPIWEGEFYKFDNPLD